MFVYVKRPYTFHHPHLFPGNGLDFIVAPFWSDIDISTGVGSVSYEVHTASDVLDWVSNVVSQHQQTNFIGRWMILAEWRNVPQHAASTETVSISRHYNIILLCYKCSLITLL